MVAFWKLFNGWFQLITQVTSRLNGWGYLVNVREDISSNVLSIETKPIESFELNL